MKQTQRFKRLLSLFLALCLVLGYIPVPGYAAENDELCEHDHAHTADCSDVEAVEEVDELEEIQISEEPKVVYATNPTLTITTAEQLADLATKVNNGTYGVCNVTLGANISLSGYSNWTPIGTGEHPFQGKFDGNGYKISDLKINATDLVYAGLFGNISDGGVRDLTVQGSVTVTQTKTIDGGCSYIGIVVGHMEDGILYHCNADGSIQTIGYNSGSFGDCNLPSVGGLAGVVNHGVVINCGSRVNVTTDVAVDVGGLIGLLSAGYDIPMCLLNSYCSGNIVSNNGTYVGGLVGLLQDDAVNNYFSGEITSDSSSTVGAAFGGVANSIVDANNNSVTFEPLIRYNYYREELETIDGIIGCNIISESMKLEADAVTVYTEPADLMRKVRGNMPFVNEVIGGHYGYLSSSEWAQLAELFDGANLAAGCWKDLNQPLGPCTFVNGVCIYCHALGGLEGNGTADSPYLISNIDELQWFVNQVNSGNQSIHGKLTNHIDMEGREWQTMASTGLYYKTTTYPDKGYQGTFDGNGHVISNFVIKGVPGEEATYGLFGTLSGTIKNLGVENMTFELNGAKDVRAGGIAGQMLDGSLIENCYVFNSTLAPKSYIVGGIAGCNYAGTIRSCFTCWVTIDANTRCGNLVSDTRGDISTTDRPGKVINCYTDGDRLVGTQTGNQVTDSEGAISGDRFASGEIAYKLGGLFGQIVKHEPCPFFGSRKVYKVPSGYRNPVERQGDAYNISNADELICFAQQVNDGLTSFNAVLTDDIVIPSDWQWTPMVLKDGDANSSTFDGQGHSITINQTYEGGSNFALFGSFNYSYIKNLTLKGSITTNSSGYVGALVGSAYRTTISNVVSYVNVTNNGTGYTGGLAGNFGGGGNRSNIENCAVYADITGNSRTGGIIGTIWNGNQPCKVTNVAYVGTVNANGSYAGAIAGYNGNQSGNTSYFTNAYYCGNSGLTHLGGSNSGTLKLDRVESKTRSAFTSGEVAYLLGEAWGQTIGTDAYPVIGGAPVYLFDNTYTNTCKHPSFNEGICSVCAGYEEPKLVDGYYQIRNVGHLYWFVQTVNEGNTTINGKLMENIVINKNVLKADGTLNGGEFRSWTPIGTTDNQYAGTFDGNGKTISGLYYNVGRNNIGFFSYTNGAEIRNLGIVDSYIKAQTWIGGVVCNASNSTISNCYYAGSISGSQSAAGIVSNLFNNSTISNCYNIGIVRSTFHPGSVVCGVRESTVSNCYYLTGTADNGISSGTGEATAKTEAEFASGEVAYLLGKAWGQKIGTDAYPVLGGEVVYKNGDTYANTCAHPSYTNQKCDACGEPCSHASYTDGQCNACGKICIHESYTNSKCDECGKICAHESYTDQKCDVCGEPCSHVSYTDGQCSACGKICIHESYTDSKCDECGKICAHESYTDQKCDVCGEPCAHEYCDKGFCSTCGGYEEPELKDGVYQISNAGQLYWFAKKVNSGDNAINGKLTKNIVVNENVLNADGTLNGTPSREWTPIGNTSRKYIGTFDGDGYTISGLYINNSEKLHVGLFGFVWDGTVQNTGVLDSYFCAKKFVGGVAGYVYNSIFSNNYNAGTISGSSYVGGVAGHLIYDTIASNCYNTGIVSGSERVGGVTGYVNEFSSLSNCYNIGSVTGSNNVGSVTGEVAIGSTAKNCYYLTGTADSGIGYGQGEAIAKTEAEFASGEVAYLLQGEQTEHVWGQKIGTDAYPVLGGEAVYQVADCVGDLAYSNTQMDLKHNYVDGICVVCGAQEEVQNVYTITYTQASISLAGDIGLNYYATLSEDLMADEGAYIVFTVAGEKQIVPISDAIVSTGNNGELTYRFSCKVVAKQMTEQVVGQMYTSDGTAVGEAKAFSVKAYCDKAIEVYSSYSQYANLVNLMKAMLNYGGYSQIQLGHNIDNLANADLADTSLPEITGADLAAYAHGKEGSESGISIMQVSLLLNSTTTIRYYFQLDGTHPIEDYTFVVDGKAAAPVLYRDNIYYVDKVDIAAKDLDVNSYVEVGGLKVWYCGMSYVRQILNTSTDTNLINVCKALYAYSEAANAYFD